jgi:hypothetical protein
MCASHNNQNDDDGRAGLSRIEIDAHGLAQWEQSGLIATETNREWRAILKKSHERDLNGSIQCVTELHDADRALNCGPCLDSAAKEHVSASVRQQEHQKDKNKGKEARHKAPLDSKVYT